MKWLLVLTCLPGVACPVPGGKFVHNQPYTSKQDCVAVGHLGIGLVRPDVSRTFKVECVRASKLPKAKR